MLKDYGSYLTWKEIYISNSLIDLYLPTTTLLLAAAVFVCVRVWRKTH